MTVSALTPRWPLTFKLGHEHLQAADTAREQRLERRLSMLGFDAWGVVRMRPDEDALERGVVAIDDFCAVLPGGAVVERARLEVPWHEPAEAVETTLVYLGIPERVEGAPLVGDPRDALPFLRGSHLAPAELGSEPLSIATMEPQVQLVLHTSPQGVSIPLFRISRLSGRWRLDLRLTPPSASLRALPAVQALVADVLARIDARLRELRDLQRWDGVDLERFDPSDAPVVWLASTLARARPRLAHCLATPKASPRTTMALLHELRGALVGLHGAPDPVRPGASSDPTSWNDLAEDLRVLLGMSVPTPLLVVPLERTEPFLFRATVEQAVLQKPLFLAASAPHELPVDDSFAALAKVGTSAVVAHAARTAVTGVPLALAHELPSVLPQRPNRLHYRLDTTSPAWAEIVQTGDLAVYLPPRDPPLELTLFVIK